MNEEIESSETSETSDPIPEGYKFERMIPSGSMPEFQIEVLVPIEVEAKKEKAA